MGEVIVVDPENVSGGYVGASAAASATWRDLLMSFLIYGPPSSSYVRPGSKYGPVQGVPRQETKVPPRQQRRPSSSPPSRRTPPSSSASSSRILSRSPSVQTLQTRD